MKINLNYLLLGILGLTACSQVEVLEVNRIKDEINFSVATYNATRASDVYCNAKKPDAFSVWATYDSKMYIGGDQIADNGTEWVNTTGTRYWPETGTLDFFAHVNAGGCFDWNGGNPVIEDFVVNDKVAAQRDLMYAINRGAAKTDGKVLMNFRHALSQIVFQAKNTNPNFHVVIDAIKICHLNSNKGTFTFSTTDDTEQIYADSNHDDNTTGKNPVAGEWKIDGNADVSYGVSFSPIGIVGNSKPVSLTNPESHTSTQIADVMMLMPQTAKSWTTESDGFYFAVKCAYYNVAGNRFDPDNDLCLWPGSGVSGTEYVILPADISWEPGNKYIYTFVFGQGNGGLKPDPDWDDPEGPDDPENPDKPNNPDPNPNNPEVVLVPITFTVTVDDFEVVNKDVTASASL